MPTRLRIGRCVGVGLVVASAMAAPSTRPAKSPPASAPASQSASQSAVMPTEPRALCGAHMRQLLMAATLWANEHKLFPPDLFAAADAEYLPVEPALVVCPVDREVKKPKPKAWAAMGKAEQLKWAAEHTSYTYTGANLDLGRALKLRVDEQIIVLTEKPHDHTTRGGGMNVGFLDGHVEFIPRAELASVTARSDAARATLAAGK